MDTSFLAQNAGKQSLTLNLKKHQSKDILLRLLNTADVVVENFRPSVMKRLGLDYETIKPKKPKLIYYAISGFGQTGPLSHRVACDQIIQGLSRVMSITGQSDDIPLRVGYPLADTIGGVVPSQQSNENITSEPSGSFQTTDGLLNIAANEEKQWHVLITHLSYITLKNDARFATRWSVLKQALEHYLIAKSAVQW